MVFVRPHALEITRQPNGANYFRATIRHINAAGPGAQVEAVTEWGAAVHVEMPQEQLRLLALRKEKKSSSLRVTWRYSPTRSVRASRPGVSERSREITAPSCLQR